MKLLQLRPRYTDVSAGLDITFLWSMFFRFPGVLKPNSRLEKDKKQKSVFYKCQTEYVHDNSIQKNLICISTPTLMILYNEQTE